MYDLKFLPSTDVFLLTFFKIFCGRPPLLDPLPPMSTRVPFPPPPSLRTSFMNDP